MFHFIVIIRMLIVNSLCSLPLICLSYALDANVHSFLTTKGVEIVLSQSKTTVSSLSECAMYCSMERSCCRSSFNAVSNECLFTSNCTMGLKASEKGRMVQKRKSLEIQTCPTGWTNHGVSCIFVSTGTLNWKQAQADCLLRGGYLAEVTTDEEMIFLRNTIKSLWAGIWIGASDEQEEGVWVWETSKDPVTVSYWYQSQPDNLGGNQNCVKMVFLGWDDLSCSSQSRYLCEQPAS